MADDRARDTEVAAFEDSAELLVAYQLDLLAHLERQLRAAHQMMRHIEKLRTAKKRIGPELSNGQRGDTLAHLNAQLDGLDGQLETQRELCLDMHETVEQMQGKLKELRRIGQQASQDTHDRDDQDDTNE